jgi:hypothetical protein
MSEAPVEDSSIMAVPTVTCPWAMLRGMTIATNDSNRTTLVGVKTLDKYI